ncbi:MAG: FAD-binding oxidoreductase, partial [Candidatus Acidiferrales bacterium]
MTGTRASATRVDLLDPALAELNSLLGTRSTTVEAIRDHHSHGESYHAPAPPDVVCFPHSNAEVSEIVKISAKYCLPIIPFGAGTSLEGNVNAIRGGI